jgi:hypothetical protein
MGYDRVTPLKQMDFHKATFWIRMYHLPLSCMSNDVGFSIGSSVGVVKEVDVAKDGVGWGEFLRVQIILDLSKPLHRGRTIRVQDKFIWVSFKFEKIPKFCFKYRVVQHGSRGCEVSGGWKTSRDWAENEYSHWLRVPSPTHRQGMSK